MRDLPLIGFALAATMLAAQDPIPESVPDDRVLTRAQMAADLDFLEAAIRAQWAYLEDKQANAGVDLAALVARAKSRLPAVGASGELHDVILELVAGLKDGFGDVSRPRVVEPSHRWISPLGDSSDGVVVRELDPKRALGWRPGVLPGWPIRKGDLILRIGGLPIEKRIAEIERTTLASTKASRRHRAIERLQTTPAKSVDLAVFSGSGPENRISLTTEAPPPPPPYPEYYDCGIEECLVWHPLVAAPGIARMWVPSFGAPDPPPLNGIPEVDPRGMHEHLVDSAFYQPDIRTARALILDLRHSHSDSTGDDAIAIRLARRLLTKRFVYFSLSSKVEGKWSRPVAYSYDPFPASDSHSGDTRFEGPLAILIDEEVAGVAENFLRAIIENRSDVVVVGRPTSGSTGSPAVVAELPASGIAVTLSTRRVYGPRGNLIEGRGTVPTIPISWTATDYREMRDPDMAAAVEALGRNESRLNR